MSSTFRAGKLCSNSPQISQDDLKYVPKDGSPYTSLSGIRGRVMWPHQKAALSALVARENGLIIANKDNDITGSVEVQVNAHCHKAMHLLKRGRISS